MNDITIARVFSRLLMSFGIMKTITDPRTRPSIPFGHIMGALFAIPLVGARSLLEIDRLGRFLDLKKLVGSQRKMVASDSTLARILRAINLKETERVLLRIASKLMIPIRLDAHTTRTLGAIDGSYINGQWVLGFSYICPPDAALAVVEPMRNRGYEREAAIHVITRLPERALPDIIVGDGLYLTTDMFRAVREQKRHILVKYPDKRREKERDIIAGAKIRCNHPKLYDTVIASGFDSQRMARVTIKRTVGEYAGYPVQILYITEKYITGSRAGKTCSFWSVTTDMALSPDAAREATASAVGV